MKKPLLIAIDGPAASGKGTIAKKVASHYNLEYLDTGRLYRAVGFAVMKSINKKLTDENKVNYEAMAVKTAKNLSKDDINSEDIETEEVGRVASIFSSIPSVRQALLEYQKTVAASKNGAVLDGRDIGSVVCPNADFKFFITAEPEIRAKRRFLQLQAKKKDVIEGDVLEDIINRDDRDKRRSIAPLAYTNDATLIDTSDKTIDEVFNLVKDVIKASV